MTTVRAPRDREATFLTRVRAARRPRARARGGRLDPRETRGRRSSKPGAVRARKVRCAGVGAKRAKFNQRAGDSTLCRITIDGFNHAGCARHINSRLIIHREIARRESIPTRPPRQIYTTPRGGTKRRRVSRESVARGSRAPRLIGTRPSSRGFPPVALPPFHRPRVPPPKRVVPRRHPHQSLAEHGMRVARVRPDSVQRRHRRSKRRASTSGNLRRRRRRRRSRRFARDASRFVPRGRVGRGERLIRSRREVFLRQAHERARSFAV